MILHSIKKFPLNLLFLMSAGFCLGVLTLILKKNMKNACLENFSKMPTAYLSVTHPHIPPTSSPSSSHLPLCAQPTSFPLPITWVLPCPGFSCRQGTNAMTIAIKFETHEQILSDFRWAVTFKTVRHGKKHFWNRHKKCIRWCISLFWNSTALDFFCFYQKVQLLEQRLFEIMLTFSICI